MFVRMIYDDKLAQAAWMIGCPRSGEALVIDPQRDVDRYVRVAARAGLRLTAVAETHVHADFLSGARQMAEHGVRAYLSAHGGDDWSYRWPGGPRSGGSGGYAHTLLRDGDAFAVGGVELRAVHTPGHTPEHLSFLVTDRGGGASEPMGMVTGDFVFVGDLGRPDLLETAAGQAGAKEPAAQRLRESARRFLELPEHVQVWPGHGAGSACGKALGAVPQSTVGYEKRFNAALRAADDEREFVRHVLAGQPEPPLYFARMKRLNRDGPAVLGRLPQPAPLTAEELRGLPLREAWVIDARAWPEFCAGHLPGALSLPPSASFPTLAGSYVEEGAAVYLVIDPVQVEEAVRDLVHVGVDDVRGYVAPAVLHEYAQLGGALARTEEIDAGEAHERIRRGAFVLDVRAAAEHAQVRIPGALNAVHTRLPERVGEVPRERDVVVHCLGGGRSARACAYLERAGFRVANLAGGISMWERCGLPVERA